MDMADAQLNIEIKGDGAIRNNRSYSNFEKTCVFHCFILPRKPPGAQGTLRQRFERRKKER